MEDFLKTKVEDKKNEAISDVELNEYISQFTIYVRTKDGTEYEPTSLRSLTVSFKRHLKKGSFVGIINDLVFEKTRKNVLQSKCKQPKKQGKRNR